MSTRDNLFKLAELNQSGVWRSQPPATSSYIHTGTAIETSPNIT